MRDAQSKCPRCGSQRIKEDNYGPFFCGECGWRMRMSMAERLRADGLGVEHCHVDALARERMRKLGLSIHDGAGARG